MKTLTHQAGYYFNDDRASGGKFTEDDVLGCCHCPRSMKRSKWKHHGGVCVVCGAKPLCHECWQRTAQFGCEGPNEKKIMKAVDDVYRQQQNSKILGI